jgi:hypothetical protein
MELYLQFGHGMIAHAREMVRRWGGGTVILSPRDLEPDQLTRAARQITDHPGGQVLLDPQFYLPRADHHRLVRHRYWPTNYDSTNFYQGPDLAEMLRTLCAINQELGCREIVLPGLLAAEVDDDWLAVHSAILEEAAASCPDLVAMPTFALSAEATHSAEQIHRLLDELEQWQFHRCYLVFEHPRGDYLVTDPIWLANVLDLVAGLKLQGRRTVVGYCNHQELLLACARADAFASGTWMNVRAFPPDKFRDLDDEILQRQTWYYCPQALSEYTLPFLDVALQQGLLDQMRPQPPISDDFVAALFRGSQPTTVGLSEQNAFRHYLHALRVQARDATRLSFDETLSAHRTLLEAAKGLLRTLRAGGVSGRHRDFTDIVDVNVAALELLSSTRGAILRRNWNSL